MSETPGYIRCRYTKGIFSTDRAVIFPAIGVLRYLDAYDEKKHEGRIMSEIRDGRILQNQGDDKPYRQLPRDKAFGEGLIKCFLINCNNTQALVDIIDSSLHERIRFRIIKENFIPEREVIRE